MYKFSSSFSAKKSKKFKFAFNKKVFFSIVAVLAVIGIASYFLVIQPALRIRAKANEVVAEAKKLQESIKANDIDLLRSDIDNMSNKYTEFENEAKSVYWASFVPYVADLKSCVEAGRYMITAGDEAIEAIYPYADLIGLKQGEQNFYEKSAEERLQTAVLTLDKMLERIDVVAQNIEEAEKRIATINPNRYPTKVGTYEVRGNIQEAKNQFEGMATLFVDAKPFLKQLPSILGAEEEKNYLILFQNTAERRATGGFYTFYAVFNINKGKITIKDSSDIYDLDNSIPNHPRAPEKILAYHKGVNQFFLRDSNLSPDFVESVKLFNSLYEDSSHAIDYDGIITMDSKVLVDMLEIFGDTQAGGINFSANIDERCDCPQVIYTLFDIVDRPVNYVKIDRKRILGNLMLELFYKAVGFSPSRYWGQLAQTMFTNLDEKHMLLYFTDPETQKAIEALNYAGRIREYDGDYLHINNVNFAGAKSNMFIDEEITSETTFENGKAKRTVKIVFKNPYEHSDCNLERGGLCLNATLRNWIRFYVPEGSELVEFKGSQTKTLTYDELGKTVFEGFMTVNPKGQAEVSIEYTLPSSITEKNYKLLIQKQPGVEDQTLDVTVEGKNMFEGPFNTDKEIK
ncbi:MAG TPA: DUF4012 domain-containing protein [Candidatus Woesebacteria bacterium]|nr:DUF4012 domain-containing protein [Candidatus Woesebacteria bacterium]